MTPKRAPAHPALPSSGSARGSWLRWGALCAAVVVAGCVGADARPRAIPDRAIDLTGHCAQTEEDGFREEANLVVRANQVDALSWQLWVGRRGRCRVELADFTQVRSRPSIELVARDGSACKLMVWQDPRRVTLAHAGCEARCTEGIYEEAWPVMFEPRTGRCGTR